MQVREISFSFNKHKSSGPRTDTREVIFSSPLTQAVAFLKGFDVGFSPKSDHHLGNLEIRVDATLDARDNERVWVNVVYGLRDWSEWAGGPWDDYYEGEIFVTVIAE